MSARGVNWIGVLALTVLSLPLIVSPAWPFLDLTHENISGVAIGLAKLEVSLGEQLGLSATQELRRRVFFREERHSPLDWLRQGSIDEDRFSRPLNHFYDPIYNRGLTSPGMALGEKAYDWALEDSVEVTGQDYSYRHAKEAYRRALTELDPVQREHWLATTFYTLGRVLHVLQDMASPAHARNAKHVGQVGIFDLGPRSVVETHLDSIRRELVYDGYTVPRTAFSQVQDLWAERDASGLPMQGPSARGLSQVINRNFVSEGTNFTAFQNGNRAVEYALPVLDTNRCNDETVTTTNADGNTIQGLVTFCANSFVDPITGVLETNPRMTTYSLFGRDAAAKGISGAGIFTLNALNAVEIGRLAIPRAVGYSAALLDYFFRGKLDVGHGINPETGRLEFRIANRSPEPLGSGGKLTVYQDSSGQRIRVPGIEKSLTDPLPKGGATYLPIPAGVDPGTLTLVYEGPLGQEPNAIIGKRLAAAKLEQVYRDPERNAWVLRTTQGVYRLPLEAVAGVTTPLDRVTWGARDNQLVGVMTTAGGSPFGPGGVARALLFEIARPVGSAEVPQVPATLADELPSVVVRVVEQVGVTEAVSAVDLNTTVQLSNAIEFTQRVFQSFGDSHCVWVESGLAPEDGWYECSSSGGAYPPLEKTWIRDFIAEFPIQLSPEKQRDPSGFRLPEHYQWTLTRVDANDAGHLIGTVAIELTYQSWVESEVWFPGLTRSQEGVLLEIPDTWSVRSEMHPPGLRFLTLVNLTTRQLLTKTSKDVIQVQRRQWAALPSVTHPFVCSCGRMTYGWVGGPDGDSSWSGWLCGGGLPSLSARGAGGGASYLVPTGSKMAASPGLYRDELAAVGLDGIEDRAWVHLRGEYWELDFGGPSGTVFNHETPATLGPAIDFPYVHLGAASAGWLHLQADAKEYLGASAPMPIPIDGIGPVLPASAGQTRSSFVRWNPVAREASRVHVDTSSDALMPITGNGSGLLVRREQSGGALWIPWDGGAPVALGASGGLGLEAYTAIEPDYLYNWQTGTFHSPTVGLPIMSTPEPLVAAAGAPPIGYHVVGR